MSTEGDAARLRRIRRFALALFALALAVVWVSAYVRLGAAGLGCADWPACYGKILAGPANVHVGIARLLHRFGASAMLILAFVAAWQSRQPRPLQPAAGRATALVVLMLLLAAIGIWSADPRRALVTFFNILGGLGLVTLSWRMALATAPAPAAARADPLLAAGIVALLAAALMGALIGARFAAASCPTLPACAGGWWPAAGGLAALDPFVIVAAPLPPDDAGGAGLHLLHRYAAIIALLLLGGAAHRALHRPAARRAARVVLVLLALEVALGAATVASGFNLWLAIGHSVNAAALLAAAFGLLEA